MRMHRPRLAVIVRGRPTIHSEISGWSEHIRFDFSRIDDDARSAVAGGGEVLPFVRQFYGQPSQKFGKIDEGITHTIPQGEGGEQGDALILLLFSLGIACSFGSDPASTPPPRASVGMP